MFTKIIATYKAIRATHAFFKEMDRKGVERFSDDWAQALRDKIIDVWLPAMKRLCGKGIFKYIETDDKIHRCAQIVLKSERLANGK